MEVLESLTKTLGPTYEGTLTANIKLAATGLTFRGDDVLKPRGIINKVMEQRYRKISK